MAFNIAAHAVNPDFGGAFLGGVESGQNMRKNVREEQAALQKAEQQKQLQLLGQRYASAQGDERQLLGQQLQGMSPEYYGKMLGNEKLMTDQKMTGEQAKTEFLGKAAIQMRRASEAEKPQIYNDIQAMAVQRGLMSMNEIEPYSPEVMKELEAYEYQAQDVKDLTTTAEQDRQFRLEQQKFARQSELDKLNLEDNRRKTEIENRKLQIEDSKLAKAQKDIEIKKVEDESRLIEAETAANNSIKLIDDLLEHPGLEPAVGAGWRKSIPFTDPESFASGSDAASFKARFDQLKGEAFLEAFQKLKGGGTITEQEGKKAESALNRMQLSQDEKEFKAAALEFRASVQAGLDRKKAEALKKGIDVPVSNADSTAVPYTEYFK